MHRPRPSSRADPRPNQEELVARAKRTDRTEARRRHRAEQAALAETDPDTGDADGATPSTKRGTTAQTTAAPQQRPSIAAAFRGAIRPLDLKGDLRAAPRVLTHWGVLGSIAIAVVSSIVYVLSTNDLAASIDFTAANPFEGKELGTVSNMSYLAFSLFVAPPRPADGPSARSR